MRTIGMLVLAGCTIVGLLAAWAPAARAQLAAGESVSGAAVGSAVIPPRLGIELPHPRARVAGGGEAPAAATSVMAIALHALAGTKWMLTRHIGLFFDYKLRTADPPYRLWSTTADPKLPLHHVFGGIAVRF